MSANELLMWARGAGLHLSLWLLLIGLVLRGFEILSLGRKPDLAPPRSHSPDWGWKAVFSRSLPPLGMVAASPTTYVGGYVFHLSLFLVIFFYAPHLALLGAVTGFSWPALPSPLVDGIAALGLAALVAVLASRLKNPVKRFLSGFSDYLAWALTFLPMLTGYLACNHLTSNYSLTLALHLLSAELLLALLPYTRLSHAMSLFLSRWYTGENLGRKGVAP